MEKNEWETSMKEMILRDENKRNENEIVVVNVNRLGGNYIVVWMRSYF